MLIEARQGVFSYTSPGDTPNQPHVRIEEASTIKSISRTRGLAIAAALLSVSALAALSVSHRDNANIGPDRAASREEDGVQPEAVYHPVDLAVDRLFSTESLADVALRADAILLGTPLSEVELEDAEVIERGEGYLGRRITVQVDRTLWQKPGSPQAPAVIETGGGTWRYSDGTRTPFIFFGEIGKQYLFVFAHKSNPADTDGYEWNHEMTLGVPMIEGRTPVVIESDKPFLGAIEAKNPEELEKLFASSLRR